ncbi:MAG: aldo/keto reductase [Melioribacteraceae bacterium]|nr:aldo/keto reductase [Melioribacteraceae bacterium]
MFYRKMPNMDEELSILGFGMMRLPIIDNDTSQIDEKKATELVRYAIDNGLNYLDTAYPYHGKGFSGAGASEPFTAKVLKDGYREKVKIATKLPSWLIKSREDMDRILNEQLDRLETDSIDFYLIHALNKDHWANLTSLGVKDFMDKALEDGKIKYAGFSFHDGRVEVFKNIVDDYHWSFCQIQYNYLDEEYQAGKEGLDYAAEKGLGIIVMEPLRGGGLVNNLPEAASKIFLESDENRTKAEWALRWIWNHKDVSLILSGMSTMDQVIENVKIAGDAEIDSMNKEELDTIDKVKTILKEKIKVDCTSCSYCMPCPTGVDIPANFTRFNEYHIFNSEEARKSTKELYFRFLSEEKQAVSCIECGECESHCPQNIPIPEKLKLVTETLSI